MALMKMMSLCLLSSALAVPAPDLSRNKRDADPLLTNFVNDLTRPFRNLFGVSSSQKRPAVTHHHHQPQHPRPRPPPVVHHPTPVHSVHYPPPQVHYPEPVYHEAPAHKPQIHILPAPDLSHAQTYDAPVAYVETLLPIYESAPPPVYDAPAPPPVYDAPAPLPVYDAPAPPPVYDAPEPPPVYDAPAPPPVYEAPAPPPKYDAPVPPPVYDAPAPTYVEAEPPVYEPTYVQKSEPAQAPAIKPDTSVINDGPLWYDSQYKPDLVEENKPESVPAVEVTLKNEEVLAPLAIADTEDREPKALLNTESIDIQISNDIDEEPIVIDLTSNQQKNNDEGLITGEEADQRPQRIKFGAPQPVSNLRPVKITDEVISFTAQQDLPSNIKFESFEIKPVPTPEAPREEEAVTPIVADQELRSFFAPNEIQSDDIEVIDLRGQLTLVNEDDQESFVPSSQEQEVTIVEEATEAISIATQQTPTTTTSITITQTTTTTSVTTTQTTTTTSTTTTQTTTIPTFFESTETEADQTTTTSTEAPQTTTELRRITFQILEQDEQTRDSPDSVPEITFEEVDASQPSGDSFSVITETEEAVTDIPPTISSDPVFQEILSAGAESEKSKRKTRNRGVYAHRYNDNFSNWYYYRSGF